MIVIRIVLFLFFFVPFPGNEKSMGKKASAKATFFSSFSLTLFLFFSFFPFLLILHFTHYLHG